MKQKLDVDVYFDFICPWCLIGKRQLERALQEVIADYPSVEVRAQWHGVQLLKDLPEGGVDFSAFYENRLGSKLAVRARQRQVESAAAASGVKVDLGRLKVMPNTAAAHWLYLRSKNLGTPAQHNSLLEMLFSAHFDQAKSLGDLNVLREIAETSGYLSSDIKRLLKSAPPYFPDSQIGVSSGGVPLFIFNGGVRKYGAASVESLRDSIDRALALPDLDVCHE